MAIERAGGDIMLMNLRDGVRNRVMYDLDSIIFRKFTYKEEQVQEKIAPKEKDGEDDYDEYSESNSEFREYLRQQDKLKNQKYQKTAGEEEYEEFEEYEEEEYE